MEPKTSMKNIIGGETQEEEGGEQPGFSAASFHVQPSFSEVQQCAGTTDEDSSGDSADLDYYSDNVYSMEWTTTQWTAAHFRLGVFVRYTDNNGLTTVGRICNILPDSVLELEDVDFNFDTRTREITLRNPEHCWPLDKEGQVEVGRIFREIDSDFHGLYDSDGESDVDNLEDLMQTAMGQGFTADDNASNESGTCNTETNKRVRTNLTEDVSHSKFAASKLDTEEE